MAICDRNSFDWPVSFTFPPYEKRNKTQVYIYSLILSHSTKDITYKKRIKILYKMNLLFPEIFNKIVHILDQLKIFQIQ